MLCILDAVFDDKRIAISCLMVWLVIVLISFNSIGLFHSDFMHLGPSPKTKIMTITIDTWHEWSMVAVASFTSTCFNDFFSDSLTPFFLNTIVKNPSAVPIPGGNLIIHNRQQHLVRQRRQRYGLRW